MCLQGVTCFVTRPRESVLDELVAKIMESGGRVTVSPLLQIRYSSVSSAEPNVLKFEQYDCVVATSSNALRALANICQAHGLSVEHLPVTYVIGEASQKVALKLGMQAVRFPGVKTGGDLVRELSRRLPQSSRVLFPRGQLADPSLVIALSNAGLSVDPVQVYATEYAPLERTLWNEALDSSQYGVVLLYSPSAVSSWSEQSASLRSVFETKLGYVAIGETTHKAMFEYRLEPCETAVVPTVDGVMNAIFALVDRFQSSKER